MKATKTARDDGHQAIFDHAATQEIVDAVQEHPKLLGLLAQIIRDFRDRESLRQRTPNLRKVGNYYLGYRAHRNAVNVICAGIETLYGAFEPSSVRGVLLEAMIQRTIQSRYGASNDILDNNVAIRFEDGARVHQTSTSIDVFGLDSGAGKGECHDCKVSSKKFDPNWIQELTENVAPFGFRIGVATADSEQVARRALQRIGIRLGAAATLVASDSWRLPLLP